MSRRRQAAVVEVDTRRTHPWLAAFADSTLSTCAEPYGSAYRAAFMAGFMAAEVHHGVAKCVTPNGRTDCHGVYMKGDGCAFCGEKL